MIVAMAFAGKRIKNNIVLFKFAEMELLIKSGRSVVRKAFKIHFRVFPKLVCSGFLFTLKDNFKLAVAGWQFAKIITANRRPHIVN